MPCWTDISHVKEAAIKYWKHTLEQRYISISINTDSNQPSIILENLARWFDSPSKSYPEPGVTILFDFFFISVQSLIQIILQVV